jgi:hypothetical protein
MKSAVFEILHHIYVTCCINVCYCMWECWSWWLCCLRHRYEELLDCWDHGFRSHWQHGCLSLVFVVCCVSSGLCDKLITCSEESYWVCVRLILCNLETSTVKQPRPKLGCCTTQKKKKNCGSWLSSPHHAVRCPCTDRYNRLLQINDAL